MVNETNKYSLDLVKELVISSDVSEVFAQSDKGWLAGKAAFGRVLVASLPAISTHSSSSSMLIEAGNAMDTLMSTEFKTIFFPENEPKL